MVMKFCWRKSNVIPYTYPVFQKINLSNNNKKYKPNTYTLYIKK